MPESKHLYSTVQLCQLNDQNLPVGIASGCLTRMGARKLLLSVEHATGNDGRWAMQMGYDKVRGAANYLVGAMNFIMRIDTSTANQTTLDFSYVEIPDDVVPTRHIVDLHGDTVSQEDILVFDPPFDTLPEVGEACSFEGAVKPSTYQNLFNKDRPVVETELMTYEGFNYLRCEADFLVFQLPAHHFNNQGVALIRNSFFVSLEKFLLSIRCQY